MGKRLSDSNGPEYTTVRAVIDLLAQTRKARGWSRRHIDIYKGSGAQVDAQIAKMEQFDIPNVSLALLVRYANELGFDLDVQLVPKKGHVPRF